MTKGGRGPALSCLKGETVMHDRSVVGLNPPLRLIRSAALGALALCATPSLAQTPAEACKQTLAQTVEFASDKTTLDATARALVRRQAKCLESVGGPVLVEGFWDDSSTQGKARELSLRIASRVRDELVKGGVAESRVKPVGHGRDQSLDPAKPTERRRVVRVVVGG
jgi:outer membrane protein OmpA-like peptidoglycan-associated protein